MNVLTNFIYGMIANANSASLIIIQAFELEFFWGIALGFIIATSAQAWLISDDPKHIPTILLNDRATSFNILHKISADKGYTKSFSQYIQTVDKVHFAFSVSVTMFLSVLVVGVLTF